MVIDMLKVLFRLFKKIVFSILFLYSYNIICSSLGIIVPINLITVISLSILGLPSLFGLIFINVFLY